VSDALVAEVGRALGVEITAVMTVRGGCVGRTLRARAADGRELFVKHHPEAPHGMFSAEAAGLAWLGDARALRTPAVLAVRDAPPAFIALEWIEGSAPAAGHDEALGRGLAALHLAGAPSFGLAADNFIATITQPNAPAGTWPEFYGARRLEPLARRARDRGLLGDDTATRLSRLIDRLPGLCGPPEPPARLHGDLWRGNAITDAAGAPVLIDPAVYGGHREMDLAMMRLFGGFSERVFAAYDEAWPLADGHADRVALYQLWPLLVHVALFGGGYAAAVERALATYV
jgi:fructosamine-3-kinase